MGCKTAGTLPLQTGERIIAEQENRVARQEKVDLMALLDCGRGNEDAERRLRGILGAGVNMDEKSRHLALSLSGAQLSDPAQQRTSAAPDKAVGCS